MPPRPRPRPERLMVEDLEVEGIHVRVYRPPGEDPKPGVLYAHGGGWTMGSCETHDDICAEIADQADVVVVLFDYRLAPEHPHPAQIEDALKVLDWMRSSGRALGIDPTHIIARGRQCGRPGGGGAGAGAQARRRPAAARPGADQSRARRRPRDARPTAATPTHPPQPRGDDRLSRRALLGPRGSATGATRWRCPTWPKMSQACHQQYVMFCRRRRVRIAP